MPTHDCNSQDGFTGACCAKIAGHCGEHGGFDPHWGNWHNWQGRR